MKYNNAIVSNVINTSVRPLVSVLIVSYNSSKYILETLESIKSQTYDNIELVITDDCSSDDTVAICEGWIHANRSRFVDARVITAEKNTGISANCNRGIKEVKGKWIRFIAGDDALFKDAVENAINYVMSNKNVKALTSSKAIYQDTFADTNLMEIVDENGIKDERGNYFYDLSAEDQYKSLLYSNKVNPTGLLINRDLLFEIGGFDERLKFLDDYPLFLKITKQGEKIFCMDKITVKYRHHDSSVQTLKLNKKIIFNKQYEMIRKFRILYIYPQVNLFNKVIFEYEYYRHHILDVLKLNRNNSIGRYLYLLTSVTSPLKIRRYFYRKSSK